jgi:hypothetical protein
MCPVVADDMFDWTDGWTGKGQFWVGQQYPDDCDNGIEADNNAENNDALPRSNPTIYTSPDWRSGCQWQERRWVVAA